MHDMSLTSDIMFSMKEMFDDQGCVARQDTMTILLSAMMVEGTPVQDHCLKMIFNLNELEVFGTEIDAEA